MNITCIGHSGFAIETWALTIVCDYYIDPASVVDEIVNRADRLLVTVSHSHRDHLCHDIFSWSGVNRYFIANECRRKLMRHYPIETMPITFMKASDTATDGDVTIRSFKSTDAGVCYLMDIAGTKVFHAGDYNLWNDADDARPQVSKKMLGDYIATLRQIAAECPAIDIAMFPVIPNQGGDFAAGARLFLETIKVGIFLPMHTWGRDSEVEAPELYPPGQRVIMLRPGETIEYTKQTQ